MVHREFSAELKEALDSKITSTGGDDTRIAAFDADGTLWDADAGEVFFQWQIDHCEFEGKKQDPWNSYLKRKEVNAPMAYTWLAQISKGYRLEEVHTWAKQCCEEQNQWPVFAPMQKLISTLKENRFQIFVITASVKWAVEPFALKYYGIPKENVLGVQTEVHSGIVTDIGVEPVTYREGKLKALLKATQNRPPLLAAGNTMGDFFLLQGANLGLALQSQNPNLEHEPALFKTEQDLKQQALQKGWLSHAFYS